MTAPITLGTRVRIVASAPVHGGKLATVHHQMTVSQRWRVTFDERDSFGRQAIGVFSEAELTVVEDEQMTLYRAWLDGALTLDEYYTAEPLPVVAERITFARQADGDLKVAWVRVDDDMQTKIAA